MTINEFAAGMEDADALQRNAGSGPVLDDTEHCYPPAKWESVLPSPFHPAARKVAEYLDKEKPATPSDLPWAQPHPHAARPGGMPPINESFVALLNERNHWRTRAEIAEAERVNLLRWLRPMTCYAHSHRTPDGRHDCPYCPKLLTGDPDNPAVHDPACPWRQAVEYMAQTEASGE